MAKVEAYRCDLCDEIVAAAEAVGIIYEEDLFDRLHSWPTDMHPERRDIHYCLECYRNWVLVPASHQVDRRKNERLYELKLQELAYGMKDTIVRRVLMNKRKVR